MFQPLPKAGQDLERLVSLAVNQLVDPALQTFPQWLEQNSHQARGSQRDEPVTLGLNQGAGASHDQGVYADNTSSQQPIDQRPVDYEIDVPQPVAADGDGQGNGYDIQGQEPTELAGRHPPGGW